MKIDRYFLGILLFISVINFFRIGYQLVIVAWQVVQITSNVAAIGQVLLVSSVAGIISAPLIGRMIDRIVSKRSLIAGGYFCVSLIVGGPFIFIVWDEYLIRQSGFFLLMGISASSGIAGMLAAGGIDYFLKTSVSSEQRLRFVALLNSSNQIALILGTGLGGFALTILGLAALLKIGAGLSLFAGVQALLFLPDLKVRPVGKRKEKTILKNFSLYLRCPDLIMIAFLSALGASLGQITNTLLPALFNLSLGRSSTDYALIESCWSLGAFFAGMFLMKDGARVGKMVKDVLLMMLMAGLLALVPFSYFFSLLLVIHFVLGAGFSYIRIRSESRFLIICPTELLGEFRANSMIISGTFGLVIYAIPTLISRWDVASFYLIFALMLFVCLLVLLLLLKSGWQQPPQAEVCITQSVSQEKV